jgi:hypothetical protein
MWGPPRGSGGPAVASLAAQVFPNLVASAVWAIPGWAVLLWRQELHHRRQLAAIRGEKRCRSC